MSVLDDLTSLFAGVGNAPAAAFSSMVPDYGAAPTLPSPSMAPAPSQPNGNILARLNKPNPQAGAPTGPLGVNTPIGGGNLAAALGGLLKVNPQSSRFGAFAQGLAGGMASQQEAQFRDRQLAASEQRSSLENLLTSMQIEKARRSFAGTDAAAPILSGRDGAPPVTAPAASPSAAGVAPPALTPTPGAPSPQGSAAPPPVAGAPTMGTASWMSPTTIAARANRLQRAGDAAWDAGDREGANELYGRAAQEQTRLTALLPPHTTLDANGRIVPLAGANEAEAAEAGAKAEAEAAVRDRHAQLVDPSGNKYLPGPGGAAPAQPGAPGAPAPGGPQAAAATPADDGPRTLTIHPDTAAISTAIPRAPAGGGYPVPNLPAGARLTEVGEQAKELAKADTAFGDMVGKAPLIDQGIERYKAAAQALKLFQSGSGAENLNAGAALADSYGFHDIARRIQGGDPAAVQWLMKEGVGLTLDTLKAAQPRFAQQEFVTVSNKGVPNPDALPSANHQLISEGMGSMMRSKAFISDWQKAQTQGWQSPSAFYNAWSAANPLESFTKAAQRQIGSFKGMELPSKMTEGATYVAPATMTDAQKTAMAARGIKPGVMFRYNGPKAEHIVEPIAADQGYSSHLQ